MYRRIVVPFDGSEPAERALPEVEGLARLTGAPVHLLRVIDAAALNRFAGFGAVEYTAVTQTLEDERIVAREQIERAERRLAERGVTVTTELRHGGAAREIVAAVGPGDLLVMASHGRGGVARWFLGSVTEEVTRRAPVSVLVVRAATVPEPPPTTDTALGRE